MTYRKYIGLIYRDRKYIGLSEFYALVSKLKRFVNWVIKKGILIPRDHLTRPSGDEKLLKKCLLN